MLNQRHFGRSGVVRVCVDRAANSRIVARGSFLALISVSEREKQYIQENSLRQ